MPTMLAPAARYWSRRHPRPAPGAAAGAGVAALDTMLPVARAQRHDAPDRAARPRAVRAAPPGARATSARGRSSSCSRSSTTRRSRRSCGSSSPQQHETRGDWPQWFMLEPYAQIRDRHSHGDVIVWPLKALCDYVEATNDLAFLDEPVAWRRDEDLAATDAPAIRSPAHVDEAPRHRARALHPRHAPDPLRRGRLERLAAAGRPAHARLDGVELDGRAAVPAARTATPRC